MQTCHIFKKKIRTNLQKYFHPMSNQAHVLCWVTKRVYERSIIKDDEIALLVYLLISLQAYNAINFCRLVVCWYNLPNFMFFVQCVAVVQCTYLYSSICTLCSIVQLQTFYRPEPSPHPPHHTPTHRTISILSINKRWSQ